MTLTDLFNNVYVFSAHASESEVGVPTTSGKYRIYLRLICKLGNPSLYSHRHNETFVIMGIRNIRQTWTMKILYIVFY